MPTYEYRCPNGHHFELFQKMSEEPRAECPDCGAASERLLSAGAGFLFKGNGFYVTDYRSDSYRKAASKEEPGGATETPAAKEPKVGVEKTEPTPTKAKDSGSASPSAGGSPSEGS